MPRARVLAGALAALCALIPALDADRAEELAERLLRDPEYTGVRLSPGGTSLAMYHYREGKRTVSTWDLLKQRGHYLQQRTAHEVYRFGWLDDERLIISLGRWGMYHEGILLANPRLSNLERLDRDRQKELLSLASSLPGLRRQAVFRDRLSKPFERLVLYAPPGRFTTLADADEMVLDYAFDSAGNFRVKLVGTEEANAYEVFHRRNDDEPWQEIVLGNRVQLHGFDATGQFLYTSREENGRTFVQAWDTEAGAYAEGVVADPHYAVRPAMIRTHDSGDLVGLVYHADKPKVVYLEPNLARIGAMLDRALPQFVHAFMGVRKEGGLLFSSWSDRHPGIVHELDIEKRSLKRVLELQSGIDPEAMAPKVPFTFPSRDGQTIRGYYTLPVGTDPASPRPSPLIVRIHGGPSARDYWGYDPEVQFFAHLGYAVLEVNYRGSEDLYGELGRFSHLESCRYGVEDVVDGVRWMVGQGLADPDRMALYGWSFGGFAAVSIAARHPNMFRCAYAAGGVYDYDELWRERREDYADYLAWDAEFLGDLENNPEAYREVSPVFQAAAIDIPVHLLHGEADSVVGARQSRLMYRALKDAGKEVELETPSWLGHGPGRESQRLEFGLKVYRFIDRHTR